MPKLLPPACMVCFLLGGLGTVRAQEDVRTIIEQAIRAQGGEEKLTQPRAATLKIKGNLVEGKERIPLTMEIFSQEPDQEKCVMKVNLDGTVMSLSYGLTGSGGWRAEDGQTQDLDKTFLDDLKLSAYVDHVSDLVDLLKDKTFVLSELGESKVEGHPAAGVKVASKGKPDVSLYFDKTSHLLVKTEYRAPDQTTGKDVSKVVILGDYRELDFAAADEQILKGARLTTDGPALLELLRRQTVSAADREKMASLVRKLGDSSFAVREKATADLVARGAVAVPLLRQAQKDSDLEIARRAEQCLEQIGKRPSTINDAVLQAAVRLVGLRKPAGAPEVLLDYLCSLPDESVAGEVQAALGAVSLTEGKPDPVLVRALDDKDSMRRSAAAAALGRTKGEQAISRLTITGIKHPMKLDYYEDGKEIVETEVVEVNFFTRLDPKVFARPGTGE